MEFTSSSAVQSHPQPVIRSSARIERRDRIYDILRVLGLFCILLSHVKPPTTVWLLRHFDVPLLIFVSGAVCQLGFRGRPIDTWSYLRKRTVRLLAPVYVFLLCYFTFAAVTAPGRFTGTAVLRTFLLLDGIGYVWVIRVFLLVALISPWLLRARHRWSTANYLLIIGGAYLVHEFMWFAFSNLGDFTGHDLIEFSLFYLVPYGCIFGLGMRWPGMARTEALLWAAVGLLGAAMLMVGLGLIDDPEAAAAHKYPPRLVYFWYGLGVSHLLYAALMRLPILPAKVEAFVAWVSASSLWVYLWHIAGLQIAGKLFARLDSPEFKFVPVWLATAAFAISATWLQKYVVRWVINRFHSGPKTTRTLEVVFLN